MQYGWSMVAALGAFLAACGSDGAPAGTPAFTETGEVVVSGCTNDRMEPFISRDGRWLFFNSLNDGTTTSLYVAERITALRYTNRGAVAGVNGTGDHMDAVPSMDADGVFYWMSTRGWPAIVSNYWTGGFHEGAVTDVRRVAGDFYVPDPGWIVMDAEIAADGATLWYANARFAGGTLPEESRLGIARNTPGGFVKLADADALLASVNDAAYLVYAPSTSADGLELYFTRLAPGTLATEICVATRAAADQAFGAPVSLGLSGDAVEAPSLSGDGTTLYYHRKLADGKYHVFAAGRR